LLRNEQLWEDALESDNNNDDDEELKYTNNALGNTDDNDE
jgi:hypothetical protein